MSPLHIKQIDKKTIRNTPSHALDRILSINSNTAIIVIARTVSKSLYTMIFFDIIIPNHLNLQCRQDFDRFHRS